MNLTPLDSREWKKAVAEERFIRESAQIGMPTLIAGGEFSVSPLTLRQQVVLYAAKNPFVYPVGVITSDDAIGLLWLLSPDHRMDDMAGQAAFVAMADAKNLHWDEVILELQDFIEDQNIDAPLPSQVKSVSPTAPVVSGAAVYVDEIAREYGWSRAEILDTPIAVLNQQRRCIAMRKPGHMVNSNRRSNAAEKEAVLARRRARIDAARERGANG